MSLEYPKLRGDLVISDRPGAASVVKVPQSGRYFQVGEAERAIMRLMDGTRTVEEIRRALARENDIEVDAPTLGGFVQQLARIGCLELEQRGPLAAGPRLRRSFVGTVFYWRVGAIRPDRFLTALAPRVRFFFTPAFVAIATLVVLIALFLVGSNYELFVRELRLMGTVQGILMFWLILPPLIVLHELAHGLTCKHFGGKIPTMGFILIMLSIPGFFTDVSDAWLFPQKRRRIWVTLAGPFFEMFLWALAVGAWWVTAPESLVHRLALAAVAASGAGMLFQFNPLVKLDGYYMLSDALEIPNLRARSFSFVGRRVFEAMTGTAVGTAALPRRERMIFGGYGVLAMSYSLLLLAWLALFLGSYLWDWFGPIGVGVLALLFGSLFAPPVKQMVEASQQLAKQHGGFWRRRRVQLGLLTVGVLVLLGLTVPVELRVSGKFVLEPLEQRPVTAEVAAPVVRVHVRQGQRVEAGALLLTLDAARLEEALAGARAKLAQAQEDLKIAERGARPEELEAAQAKAQVAQQELASAQDRLKRIERLKTDGALAEAEYEKQANEVGLAQKKLEAAKAELEVVRAGKSREEIERERARTAELQAQVRQAQRDLERARVIAPIAGVVVTEYPERLEGTQASVGQTLVTLHDAAMMRVAIRVPEREIADVQVNNRVELRVQSRPGLTYAGQVEEIAPVVTAADKETLLPDHVLVHSRAANEEGYLKPGMNGEARIICGDRTIVGLMMRRLVRWMRIEFWW
jgi:putative peptide zinc metalloprotease protein